MLIRQLDPVTDRPAVAALLTEAQDYYYLWLGHAPGKAEVEDVFDHGPPGFDLARTQWLGLYLRGQLSGLAELSFGFPGPNDAYLGLMILSPYARGAGHGAAFLAHIETLVRPCPNLYLGVLQANPKGRAFWQRHGFTPTGVSRLDESTGHTIHRLVKAL